MNADQKAAICESLNIYDIEGKGYFTYESKEYVTIAARKRYLFCTVPDPAKPTRKMRTGFFKDGWMLMGDEGLPTLMQGRRGPGHAPTPSAYQCKTKYLLFWKPTCEDVPYNEISSNIRALMPADIQPGWDAIKHDMALDPDHRMVADAAAAWLVDFGTAHGVRPPNTEERSRLQGIEEYAQRLGLSNNDLYNAQGNMFDPAAIASRLADFVLPALHGIQNLQKHKFHSIPHLF